MRPPAEGTATPGTTNFGSFSGINRGNVGFGGYGGNFGGNFGVNIGNVGNTGNIGFSGNFGNFGFGPFPLPTIKPGTPVASLLPPTHTFPVARRPWSGTSVAAVPEVGLTRPFTHDGEGLKDMAQMMAGALYLHNDKNDSFIEALVERRPDLAGLPFRKGGDCRTGLATMQVFTEVREKVREAVRAANDAERADSTFMGPPAHSFSLGEASRFWKALRGKWSTLKDGEDTQRAKVAVLMQMCGAEAAFIQSEVVRTLADIPHGDATLALTRLALFAASDTVRDDAAEALAGRSTDEATQLLVDGLRYPWPVIAARAADLIAALERYDLASDLVDMLDRPDPRSPQPRFFFGKAVPVVRELVKINHHRNCLLCHAPVHPDAAPVAGKTFHAGIPQPQRSLDSGPAYYESRGPQIAFNITYLRQDFSLMQRVENDAPWPEMQRFDFFVRERIVKPKQADALARAFADNQPYRQAAWNSLRRLTGMDAPPTSEEWRTLLECAH